MDNYRKYKISGFDNKYIKPEKFLSYIQSRNWNYKKLGYSQNGLEIYSVSIGKGSIKLGFWSQMHGNESTATRAMLDFFNYLEKTESDLLNKFTLDWIPQLNPDGAKNWSRYSDSGVDLNRDFLNESTPEMKILKNFIFSNSYKCIFNLHDQRNLFYTANNAKPTNIALLSPVTGSVELPYNYYLAKGFIAKMITKLRLVTNINLAKFSDKFYPLATGDNFQKSGIPTILVEAGYSLNDHQREEIRKKLFYLFLSSLEVDYLSLNEETKSYDDLPFNDEGAYDLIIRNVGIDNKKIIVSTDIGIRIVDELCEEQIWPKAIIQEIGDLRGQVCYEEFDAKNRIFRDVNDKYLPDRNQIASFYLGDDIFVENGVLKTEI